MLDVAEPFLDRVLHCGARASAAGKNTTIRIRKDLAKRPLRCSLREPSLCRTTTARPRWPELLLNLPTVRQPVLDVPDASALALHKPDVSTRRPKPATRLNMHRSYLLCHALGGHLPRGRFLSGHMDM